ncbi:hypothetical protein MDAP_000601 [Mitosporidium daphniae]
MNRRLSASTLLSSLSIVQNSGFFTTHHIRISTPKSDSFLSMRNFSDTTLSNRTEHLVIIGSGWGAYRALRKIDQSKYRITVVSPKDYFVFTPFLTGASVGSIEDRAAIESIRNQQSGGMFFSDNQFSSLPHTGLRH